MSNLRSVSAYFLPHRCSLPTAHRESSSRRALSCPRDKVRASPLSASLSRRNGSVRPTESSKGHRPLLVLRNFLAAGNSSQSRTFPCSLMSICKTAAPVNADQERNSLSPAPGPDRSRFPSETLSPPRAVSKEN